MASGWCSSPARMLAAQVVQTPAQQELGKVRLAASAAANPINDKRGTVEYRTQVAGVLVTRAAVLAAERANS